VGTVSGVFIYRAQKGKWLCVFLWGRMVHFCLHSCIRPILKL